MAIYIPRHFSCDDPSVAREIVEMAPFATLITSDGGEPWITHAPLTWCSGTDFIMGHVARANVHSTLLEKGCPTIAVFHGPHTFVSPGMYATQNQVPTWNYAVVHIHGRPIALSNDDASNELVRLASSFEPDAHLDPVMVARQSQGILAFRLPIERLEVKLKMSQNKPHEDQDGVIQGLRNRADTLSLEVADWMSRLRSGS